MVHTLLVCKHYVVTWDWPGTILSSIQPGTKLASQSQQIYIGASNIVLCQVDDGPH